MIKITEELLEAGKSKNGGWSEYQLSLLGVEWPPQRGWKGDALTRQVLEDCATEFIAAKDKHLQRG